MRVRFSAHTSGHEKGCIEVTRALLYSSVWSNKGWVFPREKALYHSTIYSGIPWDLLWSISGEKVAHFTLKNLIFIWQNNTHATTCAMKIGKFCSKLEHILFQINTLVYVRHLSAYCHKIRKLEIKSVATLHWSADTM